MAGESRISIIHPLQHSIDIDLFLTWFSALRRIESQRKTGKVKIWSCVPILLVERITLDLLFSGIERLKKELIQVECQFFVLISTISVYDQTHGDVDESRDVWSVSNNSAEISQDIFSRGYTPYGVHRAELESWVRENTGEGKAYRRSMIVRLPGIFGAGLSKNYIFDLMTESEWIHKVDLGTCHQWYNLALLRGDIELGVEMAHAEDRDVTVLNLFPEPLATSIIVRELFPHLEEKCKPIDPTLKGFSFLDDVKTQHWRWFESDGATEGYRYGKERVMSELRSFVQGKGAVHGCAAYRTGSAL